MADDKRRGIFEVHGDPLLPVADALAQHDLFAVFNVRDFADGTLLERLAFNVPDGLQSRLPALQILDLFEGRRRPRLRRCYLE